MPTERAPADPAAPIEARLNGVARGLTTRTLVGQGWTVAALTRPGGLGAFVGGAASDFTDRVVPLGPAIGTDEPCCATSWRSRTRRPGPGALARALEQAVDPGRVGPARQVAEVARLAETDRSVRRLGDLCERAGVNRADPAAPVPALRLGVSPTWVLRRYRLLEVAETVRAGSQVPWGAGGGRPRVRRPGAPDHRLPRRDRPDPGGLRGGAVTRGGGRGGRGRASNPAARACGAAGTGRPGRKASAPPTAATSRVGRTPIGGAEHPADDAAERHGAPHQEPHRGVHPAQQAGGHSPWRKLTWVML